MLPDPIQNFIEHFSKLPSIGPRMATRLAFYLANLDKQSLQNLDTALSDLKKLDRCPRCFFIKNEDQRLCRICENPKRDSSVIAIIEKETDLLSLEKAGVFNGVYLVLGESNGRGELGTYQKLRLKQFKEVIAKSPGGKAKEIILAISPTTEGDFLAELLKRDLGNTAEKITRLGRGIPTGAEIEFADEETLSNALMGRN